MSAMAMMKDFGSPYVHNIFGANLDRLPHQHQSATEAHLYAKNPPLDRCSTSQQACDARAVMCAKPFTERVTRGLTGVMDEKR
jgi:hypothetical protein